MSFKDKLKMKKKGKATTSKKPSSAAPQNTLDDLSSIDNPITATKNTPAKPKRKGLFAKKTPKPKTPKSKTKLKARSNSKVKGKPAAKGSSVSELKRKILMLGLLLIVLLGVLGYFFMQSQNTPEPVAPFKPAVTKPAAPAESVTPQPDTVEVDTANTGAESDASSTPVADNTDINASQKTAEATPEGTQTPSTPEIAEIPAEAAPGTTSLDALDEEITTDLPENKVQAAEEIDMYTDEQKRLDEQETLLEEQIAAQEKILELKAERVKLLEQQIQELEKQ